MQDKALQSEKMQDNPAKSRTVGNSGQLKVIRSFLAGKDVFPILPWGMERAFAMLFSRSFLIACIDCKEIAAAAS